MLGSRRIRLSIFVCSLAAGWGANAFAQQPAEPQRPPDAPPSAVVPPQVLDHVDAVYPPSQLARNIETNVVVFVTVERDGSVSDASVAESGGEEFDAAALAAVKQWRFVAATRDGQPIRARIRVPFHFSPGPHATSEEHERHEREAKPAPDEAGKPKPPPTEFTGGVAGPHAVAEPGQPIEIHVQGRPNPPRRAASDFRFDRTRLTIAPHATAADLLTSAPGVHVSHPEGEAVAQRIYLRGFDADHGQDVEFRVGPIPLNQRSHIHGQGYADLNVIIPETVRSLRVVEGVYDPQQGDFAVAGSAEYDLGVEERGVKLAASYGSFATRRVLGLWAPEGQSEDTFAAAAFRQSDGFGDGTRGSISGGATGQYRFDLPGDFSALLHVAGYGARAGLAGVLRRDDYDAGRVGFYDTYDDPSAQAQSAAAHRAQVGITVDRTGDDGSHRSAAFWLLTAGYRSRLNFTGYTQRSRTRPEWAGRGDLVEQANQDLGIGGRMTYRAPKHAFTSWLSAQLALGAEVQHDGIDQQQNLLQAPQNETWDERVDATVHATDVALWGDVLVGITRWARLRAGLRGDLLLFDVDDRLGNFIPAFQEQTHIEGFRRTAAGLAWGPRATLEGDPARWLRLMASYGQGYRSPQARQLEEGESAPFAEVHSYELGARAGDERRWTVTLAAYETRLSYDLAFDAEEARLERIGPTTRRGFVVYSEAHSRLGFDAAVSATFVSATLDDPPPPTPSDPTPPYIDGQQLPFVPPVVVRADAGFRHDIARVAGEALSGRVGYGATFLSPRPLPYGQEAAPVFLVDASASLRRTFLELGVEAMNLLDAQYADTEYSFVSNWLTTPAPSLVPARHFSAGPPLTVLGTVTVHLGGEEHR